MNSYTLQPVKSCSLKISSIQTVHSVMLKFGMYNRENRPTYCIHFGKFRLNSCSNAG